MQHQQQQKMIINKEKKEKQQQQQTAHSAAYLDCNDINQCQPISQLTEPRFKLTACIHGQLNVRTRMAPCCPAPPVIAPH
jgi:hypothetical protein